MFPNKIIFNHLPGNIKNLNQQMPLKHMHYLTHEWYNFAGSIITELYNELSDSSILVMVSEYLPYYILPILHKSKIVQNGESLNF